MGRAKKRKTPTAAPLDVFEADDGAADAMTDKRRYVGTDVYEYEMPDNFDDEEIDSDEAFNDEDRRKYGSLFGGSAGAEQDDEAPGEAPELEHMLFAYDSEEGAEGAEPDGDDDGGHGDSDDDDDDGFDPDAPAPGPGVLSELSQYAGPSPGAKVRVRDEPAREGEFNLVAGVGEGEEAVSLAMLAKTLEGNRVTRRAIERLAKRPASAVSLGPETAVRLERGVAYQKASRRLTQWNETVAANRSLRTQRFGDDTNYKATLPTIARISTTFEPMSDLEKAVAATVVDEGHVKKFEDLATRELTVEEVRARNAQLAKMRSLMFFDELKARRRKLIKSKKYRKILRRTQEKAAPSLDELKALDSDAAKEEVLRQEKARALERVTLRHRNTGTWVKGALRKAQHKAGTREAIQEQLRVGEELRRKMDLGSEDESDDDDDDDDVDDDGQDQDGDDDEFIGVKERDARGVARPKRVLEESESSSSASLDSDDAPSSPVSAVPPQRSQSPRKQKQHWEQHGDEAEHEEQRPDPSLPALNVQSVLQNPPRSHVTAASSAMSAQLVGARVTSQAEPAPIDMVSDAVWQFEEDRKKLEPDPQDKADAKPDASLGWGSWTGEGIVTKPKKAAPARGPRRRDYSGTIVKADAPPPSKYLVAAVPFPYTSAEQYEADLALPVGQEWNSRLAHDALKMPDVIVRSGVYLEPARRAHWKQPDDLEPPSTTESKKDAKSKKKEKKDAKRRPPGGTKAGKSQKNKV